MGVKLIGVFLAASGVIQLFATIASMGIRVEGLPDPGVIARLNLVAVFAELAVACACMFAGDTVASRVFSGRRRIQLPHMAPEKLFAVGIALVGVSSVASAVPPLVEFLGRAIWFSQGSLQSQFLPSMERSWEPVVRNIIALLIGVVLVAKAGRLAPMLDRGGSTPKVEHAD